MYNLTKITTLKNTSKFKMRHFEQETLSFQIIFFLSKVCIFAKREKRMMAVSMFQ